MAEQQKFESWAIVEVMGHKRLAGFVSEQAVGGASFIRVDVPECDGVGAFTQLLGASSIYAITPCTEEVAKRACASFRARPVQYLDLSRALPAPAGGTGDETAGDEDDLYDDEEDRPWR